MFGDPESTLNGQPAGLDEGSSRAWSRRSQLVLGIDTEICLACGEAMRSLACIEDPEVIEKTVTRLYMRGCQPAETTVIGHDSAGRFTKRRVGKRRRRGKALLTEVPPICPLPR